MSNLIREKLHIKFLDGISRYEISLPRTYTSTHSDRTADLFLTIVKLYNLSQISGWYTRLIIEEVLAHWERDYDLFNLHVICHVSGGLIIGTAGWCESIFRKNMPLVLESFINGDQELFQSKPEFDKSWIWIHF